MTQPKPCTKARYNNEVHARTLLNKARKRRFLKGQDPDTWEKNVYLCRKCEGWHLTHWREKDWLTRKQKK